MMFVCVGSTPHMAFDRTRRDRSAGQSAESAFIRARKIENSYGRQLRKIAKHIADIVDGLYDQNDPFASEPVVAALNRYAGTLDEWARSVGSRMVAEVDARDKRAWFEVSRRIGEGIRENVESDPVGQVMRARLDAQTPLIKSLPLEAAERVRALTLAGITEGRRASDVAEEIMRSGQVSRSRATLIARTEVSRTATELTRARAERVGSTMFKWVTVGDSDVRPSHRRLNGKTFRWDDPPECDPGHRALPGAIWNCRCVAVPILDEDDD